MNALVLQKEEVETILSTDQLEQREKEFQLFRSPIYFRLNIIHCHTYYEYWLKHKILKEKNEDDFRRFEQTKIKNFFLTECF